MNVRERYEAAYRHQPVDRVPIALSYFHAGFARQHLPPPEPGADPLEASIQAQLHYGFDPHAYVRGTGDWFLARPNPGQENPAYAAAGRQWRVTERATTGPSGTIRTDYAIETPGGTLTCVRLATPDDFGTIPEPFLKEEGDLDLLRYRPEPRDVIEPGLIARDGRAMGDRCWAMASVVGMWGLASFLRGPERIMVDCFDRPAWVKRLGAVLADYQVELVKAIGRASPGLVLRLDASFVGFGISRRMFNEFIRPFDARIVRAAHDVGMPVHLHICGKKNAFLEDLADMGLDALETLSPAEASGDVVLADVKRRIGHRVCLMGGFMSHTLTFGTPQEVEAGVVACLEAAAAGSGYILSPCGRIDPETPEENLYALTAAGRQHGAGVR